MTDKSKETTPPPAATALPPNYRWASDINPVERKPAAPGSRQRTAIQIRDPNWKWLHNNDGSMLNYDRPGDRDIYDREMPRAMKREVRKKKTADRGKMVERDSSQQASVAEEDESDLHVQTTLLAFLTQERGHCFVVEALHGYLPVANATNNNQEEAVASSEMEPVGTGSASVQENAPTRHENHDISSGGDCTSEG